MSQDGWIRTSDLVLPKHAEYQAFPHPEIECAQWESNPHFRHGKAAGCHYIMGACLTVGLSKIEGHRAGLEPAFPLYESGVLAARRPVLVVSGTGGHRTHIVRFKQRVHYLVCHSPNSVGAEGIEPSSDPYKRPALTMELRAIK